MKKLLPRPVFSFDMDPKLLFVLSSLLTLWSLPVQVEPAQNYPQITVMGMVYCDICSNNTFYRHSYFLPGANVRIDCIFDAISPRTILQISFSVNRTTEKHGVYKLEILAVDGIACAREREIKNSCKASLMWSSSSSCNVPGYTSAADEIAIKSVEASLCIYSLGELNYRPSKRDITLC